MCPLPFAEDASDHQRIGEWQPFWHRGCDPFGHSADLGNSDLMCERKLMRTGDLNFGLYLVSALLLAGCATVVVPLDPQLVSERFPFIREGKTSKQEVLSRLGEPYSRYEGEQILTYVMCEDISRGGGRLPSYTRITDKEGEAFPGKAGCSYERTNNLILVFGPDDLVARHSVVLINLVKRLSVELWR